MSHICIAIIFNHKYNENIPILEKIYRDRFSSIYYIVPFNVNHIEGIEDERVIGVYETSYCFQGYIAQAYERIQNKSYTHYVFIGDDQILNPKLNENNLLKELGIIENESYIKEIIPYDEISDGSLKDQSNKLYNILSAFRINVGVSYRSELPTYEEACKKCHKHGLRIPKKLPIGFFCSGGYISPKHLPLTLVTIGINRGFQLPYPLYKAYSDMIIIDKQSMREFSRISGVLAAMNVFVESAIPLAMLLACKRIKTEKEINGYRGIEFWNKEIDDFQNRYDRSLKKLLREFEENVLYYHPVKLSKWRRDV